MISNLRPVKARTISSISGTMLPASLRTGTTIEISGMGKGLCRGLLLAADRAGKSLDAGPGWTGFRDHPPGFINTKGEAASRKGIPDQDGEEGTDQAADQNIADMMRQQNDAAHGDHTGIDP